MNGFFKVPLPVNLGGKKGEHTLDGVDWFMWQDGIEFTYFYSNGKRWSTSKIETSGYFESDINIYVEQELVNERRMEEHGYPLTGKGKITGINLIKGRYYAEIILTSAYLMHLKVECDEHGRYIEGGRVLFPPTPSFETIEKREKYLLARYKYLSLS